jgi:hypothetical protein
VNISNGRPSHGVDFRNWVQIIQELFENRELTLPPKYELERYFREDFSYEEVINKELFKNHRNVWMECHVLYQDGHFVQHFNTSAQAKDFFRKYPEVRDELEKRINN